MTGDQCREARERVDGTRLELATAADVPLWFIAAFEDGKATPDFSPATKSICAPLSNPLASSS